MKLLTWIQRLTWILIGAAIVGASLYVYNGFRDAREAKEASMFRFLTSHLRAYKESFDEYPESLEAGIERGLLERFPINRIDYYHEAYKDGRFRYTRSQEVGFELRMSCGDRVLYADANNLGNWEHWDNANQPNKSE